MSGYAFTPTRAERALIESLVEKYKSEQSTFEQTAASLHLLLTSNPPVKKLIHSSKFRAKDPEHLRDKLYRKLDGAKREGKNFNITPENIFRKLGDLAGVRLLHLHTAQMTEIHPIILKLLDDNLYSLVEKPTAHTWDDEYRAYFKNLNMTTKQRISMYTSVHYVVAANNKLGLRCELQLRTLMEEVWGEVSHTLDYPHKTTSIACQEQLKVLARVASSGTRLVDAIFKSQEEHISLQPAKKKSRD